MSNVRWTLVVAAAVLAAAATPAAAFNPQPEPPLGLTGLAKTQMAILNAVLSSTPDDGQPPDPGAPPCVMDLSFRNALGEPFHDAAGNEVTLRVELRGHAAASLVLRSQDVVPTGQVRVAIRGVVQPPDPQQPPDPACDGLVATLEIVDSKGLTQVLATSLIQPVSQAGLR